MDPDLQLIEAAPGSGDVCRSTFLNRIFEKYLNERFRGHPDWEENSENLPEMLEHFETRTKNGFSEIESASIPVYGLSKCPGIVKNRLILSADELKNIFEPIVSQVITLVRKQIQETGKKVRYIVLVGGFGCSPYLRDRIKKTFEKADGLQLKSALNTYVNKLYLCIVHIVLALLMNLTTVGQPL